MSEQIAGRTGAGMGPIRKGIEVLERLSVGTLLVILAVLMSIGLIPMLMMAGVFA
jgi:hypothetical protein